MFPIIDKDSKLQHDFRTGWPRGDGWYTAKAEASALVNVDPVDGITWTYPEGFTGGKTPGAKVTQEGILLSPVVVHHDENVLISNPFHGHWSGVNKWRYPVNDNADGDSIIGFFGSNESPLTIGFNSTRWAVPVRRSGMDQPTKYRFRDFDNLAKTAWPDGARPDILPRGEKFNITTVRKFNTPGVADGVLKLYINQELVLHFVDLDFQNARGYSRGVHYAPVWGGLDDAVPQDQSVSVEQFKMWELDEIPEDLWPADGGTEPGPEPGPEPPEPGPEPPEPGPEPCPDCPDCPECPEPEPCPECPEPEPCPDCPDLLDPATFEAAIAEKDHDLIVRLRLALDAELYNRALITYP